MSEWTVDTLKEYLEAQIRLQAAQLAGAVPTREDFEHVVELLNELALTGAVSRTKVEESLTRINTVEVGQSEVRTRLDRMQGESVGQSDTVGRWIAVAAAIGSIAAVVVVLIHP